jgi:hypothetical protein
MTATNLTFEEFQSIVESEWKNAQELGEFRDYSPEFENHKYNPGRIYYTWQHYGFGCVAYDTLTSQEEGRSFGKKWMADAGRGMHGWGDTLPQAFADENAHYL